MGDADGGLRLIDVLAAGTGGTERVDLQILGVDGKFHFLRLRHDGHSGGRGLDAAGGLRFRYALDAVGAGLELQAGPRARALHLGADLLDAAQLRVVFVDDAQRPALALGIHGVHPQEVGGKQSSLFPTDTGAYLQDHVFVVIGVFGKQQAL